MKPPKQKCWFCDGIITRMWKIKRMRRKKLEGAYCSKECCASDIWGPRYRGANPHYLPNDKVIDGR